MKDIKEKPKENCIQDKEAIFVFLRHLPVCLQATFYIQILVGDPDEIEKAAEESGFRFVGQSMIDPKKFDRKDGDDRLSSSVN